MRNYGPKTISVQQVESNYNSIPQSCHFRVREMPSYSHKILSPDGEEILMVLGLEGMHLLSNQLRSLSSNLSKAEQWEIYCMCDGFGKKSPNELLELNDGWDWSHVRDSSGEAIEEAVKRIREILVERYNSL